MSIETNKNTQRTEIVYEKQVNNSDVSSET